MVKLLGNLLFDPVFKALIEVACNLKLASKLGFTLLIFRIPVKFEKLSSSIEFEI
ncbi:hypothetical protein [Tenacibaculum piscium]|uniref:hypothetical protein n=1 Tax=Tenacibaculum piscium TaxID=1458515 RepID=UPI001F20C9D7|nr:hypothetical protein [Tenacibaculum piscium]